MWFYQQKRSLSKALTKQKVVISSINHYPFQDQRPFHLKSMHQGHTKRAQPLSAAYNVILSSLLEFFPLMHKKFHPHAPWESSTDAQPQNYCSRDWERWRKRGRDFCSRHVMEYSWTTLNTYTLIHLNFLLSTTENKTKMQHINWNTSRVPAACHVHLPKMYFPIKISKH